MVKDCKYLEYLTETQSELLHFDEDIDKCTYCPVEVCVGIYCHLKNEYNIDCEDCLENIE